MANGRETDDSTKLCPYHFQYAEKFEAICKMLEERDRTYRDREASSREAIKAAFNAAERAAEKTEAALKEYKISSNEWRDTVKDLVSKMITRPDVERELKTLENQIADLREYRSNVEGRAVEKTETRTQSNWSTGMMIVGIIAGINLIIVILHMVGVGK